MDMKIGIIGTESSHSSAIANIINIKKMIKGYKVEYLWGENKETTKKTAIDNHIPRIVENPSEMLDKIDAVLILHRDGKYHLRAAKPFIKAGIPAFIDKPLCCKFTEGRKFLEYCSKDNVAVTSFSVLIFQASFRNILKKLPCVGKIISASICGTCDVRGPYGGVYFLGSHLVEMAIQAFGNQIEKVYLTENKSNGICNLFYKDGLIVTINCIPNGINSYVINVIGTKKSISETIQFDSNLYLTGVKTFTEMFKTGKMPLSYERILKPVQILEAMNMSLESKRIEKIKAY